MSFLNVNQVSTAAGLPSFTTSNNAINFNGNIIGASSSATMKNRIINGDMRIDQRNNGSAVGTSVNGYSVDRWQIQQSTTGKLNGGQNYNSVTTPSGFTNYLGVQSQSAYSISSTDYYTINQRIEGYNIADLGWGTSSAKTVTISFWVYSSLTGTFGGVLQNYGYSWNYPFTYTINSSNTWQYITVTITPPTSGSWQTGNSQGVNVIFGLGVGSTYSGTPGIWTSSNVLSATGATSVVAVNNATFYITGVQFEVGSVATSFDYRDYGRELQLCQRYYYLMQSGVGRWNSTNASACVISAKFDVQMRTTPTTSGMNIGYGYVENFAGSNPTISSIGGYGGVGVSGMGWVVLNLTGGSGSTIAGYVCEFYVLNNTYGLAWTAEL